MEARALGVSFLMLLVSSAATAPDRDGEGKPSANNKALLLAGTIARGVEAMVVSTDRMLPDWYRVVWETARNDVITPAMRVLVAVCLILSLMLLAEVLFMSFVSLTVKIFRLTPEKRYKWDTINGDLEAGSSNYPMILVQIPMYNEKEVYKLSIGAACGLSWPSDRIIVQVLDDSTDPEINDLVELECNIWASKGMHVVYEVRDNRRGYKAGALKEGMDHSYAQQCDYVVIFDADFQPESDFLMRTIPFLVHNPKLALVQARWEFVNADECLMTRMQEMTMDYHFKVEQEAGSIAWGFFGFNGTAGVWRILAINEAGGWEDRTTVEDMDLAVRASLRDWKFVYNSRIKVKSELPSTFKAYRYQQHRWSCGPALLLKKMFWQILLAKKVSCLKKVYIIYNFFFVRRIVANVVTFLFYCFIIPVSIFFPEIEIPKWSVVYVPAVISLLNVVGTPRFDLLATLWKGYLSLEVRLVV